MQRLNHLQHLFLLVVFLRYEALEENMLQTFYIQLGESHFSLIEKQSNTDTHINTHRQSLLKDSIHLASWRSDTGQLWYQVFIRSGSRNGKVGLSGYFKAYIYIFAVPIGWLLMTLGSLSLSLVTVCTNWAFFKFLGWKQQTVYNMLVVNKIQQTQCHDV